MAPLNKLPVRELFESSGTLYRACFWSCLPLGLSGIIVLQLPNLYLLSAAAGERGLTLHAVLTVLACFAATLLFAMTLWRQQLVWEQRSESWPTSLRQVMASAPRVLLAQLAGWLALALGLLALLAPGIYWLVCLVLLVPVALFEGLSPFAAMRRCYLLAKPQWVKLLAIEVIAALMLLIFLLLATILIQIVAQFAGGPAAPLAEALSRTLILAVLGAMWCYLAALGLVVYTSASASA